MTQRLGQLLAVDYQGFILVVMYPKDWLFLKYAIAQSLDTFLPFCQTASMSHSLRKFIAILMLLWLPLFSGNVLAVSVVMQTMDDGHQGTVAQQGEPHMHCSATVQQHAQHARLAVAQDQSADHQDQQSSAHENCGTCHFACGGYMATASIKVMDAQPLVRLFTTPSPQFQSITLIPLDPPPLARV